MSSNPSIGILCGGGPAPGINSVISAATIEAVSRCAEVAEVIVVTDEDEIATAAGELSVFVVNDAPASGFLYHTVPELFRSGHPSHSRDDARC